MIDAVAAARARVDAQPLTRAHRDAIEPPLMRLRAALGSDALSDCTFNNLYLFRAAHDYRYVEGAHACVSGVAYDGSAHLLPLFDVSDVTPAILSGLLRAGECLYPLSGRTVAQLEPGCFTAERVRDDCDYLYEVDAFRDYHAKPLRGQRQAVQRLQTAHRITAFDLWYDGGSAALHVLAGWCEDKHLAAGGADEWPCREAIAEGASMGLSGRLYCVDDTPAGFLVTEALNPGVLAVRFAKGRSSHEGIYPLMFQSLCRELPDGVRWLNFEQDLGKPNFRRSKLSYAPLHLIDKFRVRLARV